MHSFVRKMQLKEEVKAAIEKSAQLRVEEQDLVNKPFHYTASRIECIDAMQAMLSPEEFIGYLRGNIFKYQWRYRHKNLREDLEKSQWYLTKLIALTDSKGASHAFALSRKDQRGGSSGSNGVCQSGEKTNA